ncbi:MAG: hypothetical protein KAR62_00775 [Sphingomonadales bacterium]|nr:hypothetical protein [Sphingomonadales bacterium]
MTSSPLVFKAGAKAKASIEKNGFDFSNVKVVVAASGGAKWLALNKLDRVMFPMLADVKRTADNPLFLLGSSIGAWRMGCLAQKDPSKAIAKFEDAYCNTQWGEDPDIDDITRITRQVLEAVFSDNDISDILSHNFMRMNILAVKSKGLLAREARLPLTAGLLAVASMNAISRKTLGLFFDRALFSDPRHTPPFASANDLPIGHFPLMADNYLRSVMATSSIPLVIRGEENIPHADKGMYRDGGFTDYHFDMPFLGEVKGDDDLVLYPHYRERIIPGWFDKPLKWRKPSPQNTAHMIQIAPSDEFAASLPYGKIPDRGDFKRFDTPTRMKYWNTVLDETDRLADTFAEVIEKENMAEFLTSL